MRFSFTAGIKHTPALVQSVSHYLLLGLCFHTLVSAQSQPSLRPWSQTPVSDPGLRPGSQTPVSDLGLRPGSQTPVSDSGLRPRSQTPVSDSGLSLSLAQHVSRPYHKPRPVFTSMCSALHSVYLITSLQCQMQPSSWSN